MKQSVDICRNNLPGYDYFDLFDSPGNTIRSQPSKTLEELASECDTDANCQGFNSDGQTKSLIQTTPHWSKWLPVYLMIGLEQLRLSHKLFIYSI